LGWRKFIGKSFSSCQKIFVQNAKEETLKKPYFRKISRRNENFEHFVKNLQLPVRE